jgi:hypothetical protein
MKHRCAKCEGFQKKAYNEQGGPVWECLNCYAVTPRRTRKASAREAAKRAALDALFNELVGDFTPAGVDTDERTL